MSRIGDYFLQLEEAGKLEPPNLQDYNEWLDGHEMTTEEKDNMMEEENASTNTR